jgi:hypothetical protein
MKNFKLDTHTLEKMWINKGNVYIEGQLFEDFIIFSAGGRTASSRVSTKSEENN